MLSKEDIRKNMEADRAANRKTKITYTNLRDAWNDGFHQGWYAGTSRMVTEINGEKPPYYLG